MKLLFVYHRHASAIIPEERCTKMWDRTFYRVVEKQRYMGSEHNVISLGLILILNDHILSVLSAY